MKMKYYSRLTHEPTPSGLLLTHSLSFVMVACGTSSFKSFFLSDQMVTSLLIPFERIALGSIPILT